ncbi:MAG: hypothetical protein R3D70_04355 [Rhizobiaceae bacterium]
MVERVTFPRIVAALVALLAVLFAVGWATRQDPSDKPYLKIVGGGFVYNFRIAEVFYGFTALVVRPLSSGSVIEATFDDPGGGDPLVVRERVSTMTDRYSLRSPPVRGVVKDKVYKVAIRVLDREEKYEIWGSTLDYRSQIDDTVVPEKPLTIGPGYQLNPDAEENKNG